MSIESKKWHQNAGARRGCLDQSREHDLDWLISFPIGEQPWRETLYELPDLGLGERIDAMLPDRPLRKSVEAGKNEPGHR